MVWQNNGKLFGSTRRLLQLREKTSKARLIGWVANLPCKLPLLQHPRSCSFCLACHGNDCFPRYMRILIKKYPALFYSYITVRLPPVGTLAHYLVSYRPYVDSYLNLRRWIWGTDDLEESCVSFSLWGSLGCWWGLFSNEFVLRVALTMSDKIYKTRALVFNLTLRNMCAEFRVA